MSDPVFQGLSSVYTEGADTGITQAQVTFSTVTAGELVLVQVQRDSYSAITGVTLGVPATPRLVP